MNQNVDSSIHLKPMQYASLRSRFLSRSDRATTN